MQGACGIKGHQGSCNCMAGALLHPQSDQQGCTHTPTGLAGEQPAPGITATSSWLNGHGPEATSRPHLDEQAEQTSGFLPERTKDTRGLWTRNHGGARDACSEKGPKLPSGRILLANGSQLPDVKPKPGVCHVLRRLHTSLKVSLSEPEEPVRPGRDSLEDSAPAFPPLESSLQRSGATQIPRWEHREPPASQRLTAG